MLARISTLRHPLFRDKMSNKCTWCDIAFETIQQLRMHLKIDVEEHRYYCQLCKRTFIKLKALKEHLNSAVRHRNKEPTENMVDLDAYCLTCRRQFDTSARLLAHFSVAHELCCEICCAVFARKLDLENHMASPVHNPRDIPCPHCTRLYKTTSGVAHHLEASRLQQTTAAVVKWDVDNQITDPIYTNRIREFESDDEGDDILVVRRDKSLDQILNVTVTEEAWDSVLQAYVCPVPYCKKQFRKLGGVNHHLGSQKHRTNAHTFHCPKCESRFAVISALTQHLESAACDLAETDMVKDIYNGLRDSFKKLLNF